MSKGLIERSILTDIADAIREKTGTEDPIKPVDMADAVRSISGGHTPEYDTKIKHIKYIISTYAIGGTDASLSMDIYENDVFKENRLIPYNASTLCSDQYLKFSDQCIYVRYQSPNWKIVCNKNHTKTQNNVTTSGGASSAYTWQYNTTIKPITIECDLVYSDNIVIDSIDVFTIYMGDTYPSVSNPIRRVVKNDGYLLVSGGKATGTTSSMVVKINNSIVTSTGTYLAYSNAVKKGDVVELYFDPSPNVSSTNHHLEGAMILINGALSVTSVHFIKPDTVDWTNTYTIPLDCKKVIAVCTANNADIDAALSVRNTATYYDTYYAFERIKTSYSPNNRIDVYLGEAYMGHTIQTRSKSKGGTSWSYCIGDIFILT